MHSKFGFVLSGPVLSPENCTSSTNLLVSTHRMKIQSEFINENVKLSEMVDNIWNLESRGIYPTEASIYDYTVKHQILLEKLWYYCTITMVLAIMYPCNINIHS